MAWVAAPLVGASGLCDLPIVGQACHLPAHLVQQGWAAVVDSFARSVGTTLTLLFTFWEKVPAPALSSAAGSPVGDLQGLLWWVVGPVAVAAVLVGAGRMAWSQRAQPGVDVVRSVALLSVVLGCGVTVTAGLVTMADQFAGFILSRSAGGDFQARLTAMAKVNLAANPQLGGDSAVVLLVALVAIVGSLVQCAVLVLRGALLVVMVATLPLSAAATNTEMGRAWFKKSTAWLVAFILIKPAAACLYAVSFYLISDGADVVSQVGGVMLIALSAFTLPALLRILVPAVASVASGIGAGEALAGGGAIAAGALGAAGMASGSSGNGPPSASHAAAAGSRSGGTGGGGGSGAGLSAAQSSPLAAEAVAAGAAGTPLPATGSGGGAGGGGGAGLAAGAAAAAGGPAGFAAQAGLKAAGEAARGARKLGEAAAGDGETS